MTEGAADLEFDDGPNEPWQGSDLLVRIKCHVTDVFILFLLTT